MVPGVANESMSSRPPIQGLEGWLPPGIQSSLCEQQIGPRPPPGRRIHCSRDAPISELGPRLRRGDDFIAVATRRSVDLRARRLDHLRPFVGFRANVRDEFLGRTAGDLGALREQLLIALRTL